jgi:hypothetical protein
MSHFSPLNILLSLRVFLDLLLRYLPTRLHFILGSPPRNILPQAALSFDDHISLIRKLLKTHDDTSETITSAVNDLKSLSPSPWVEIVAKDVWPRENTCISVKTHLKSTFDDAVNRLKATGRVPSSNDMKYLHLLLTHICGWSATYSIHLGDPFVKFFRLQYPQLTGLVPILDSMTYPEELKDFPEGYRLRGPWFFLLATPNCYYVYDVTDGEEALFVAGESLEEVYVGLRDWRWADSSDNIWEIVDEVEWISPTKYFPKYYRKDNGVFGKWGSKEEYPARMSSSF